MMKLTHRLIASMLRDTADKIEQGSCGLDDDEILEIASALTHRKMNIEQTCQHYGISRATLNRWQQCGKLPPFHKDSGGKDYLWQDEADASVAYYEDK